MRSIRSCSFLLPAVLALAGARAYSQTNIAGNQSVSIYVDAQGGSDVGTDAQLASGVRPGAQSAPFKSLQAAVNLAVANNRKSIGSRIVVNSGVYRESLVVPAASGLTNAPISIQAATTGSAVLSGSDVLTDWNQESWDPDIYSHAWNYNLGTCPVPSGWPGGFAPIALHTEMIFVNGIALTQVLSYSALQPGTFYVNQNANQIYVAPAPWVNMSTATVEAATRRQVLNIAGQHNITVRGLVLTHAANCINTSAATITNSSNVLVDQVQAVWNNWGGLGVFSSNSVTLQNSVASYNGGVGFQVNQATNTVFNYVETDYNNWRGAQAALYDWGMGGMKLMRTSNSTVENVYSFRNQAQGLWFDTDNRNAIIRNVSLSENTLAALQVERNPGPVSVSGSNICSNGIGVNVLTSEGLSMNNNLLYNNGGTNVRQAQIYLAGTTGGQRITDSQSGQTLNLFTTNMSLHNNLLLDASTGQNVFGTYLSGDDWSRFAYSLDAGGNTWFDPFTANAFKITGNRLVNFAGWRNATGTDFGSGWFLPNLTRLGECAIPSPSYPDFSVNLDSGSYTMYGGQAAVTAIVNSFDFGPVSLNVTGLPSGVSAWFDRENLVSGRATLYLQASKWVRSQTVPVTLWANGSSRVHSVTFSVHVIPVS